MLLKCSFCVVPDFYREDVYMIFAVAHQATIQELLRKNLASV